MWTLLVDSLLSLLTAALYVRVGITVNTRATTGPSATASDAFTTWWFLTALAATIGAILDLGAYAASWPSAALAAFLEFQALCLVLGTGFLVYFLVYLFTGNHALRGPILAIYLVAYLGIQLVMHAAGPLGVEVRRWGPTLITAIPLARDPASAAVAVMLAAPPVMGLVAYLGLLRRTDDPAKRYRISMVGSGLLLWMVASPLASFGIDPQTDLLILATRVLAVTGAIMVYLAYRPPDRVAAQWT